MERDKSCEERIDGHLAGRLDDFREFQTRADRLNVARDSRKNEERREELEERRDEYPLHVSVERVVVVLLSTGGPHDEFRCTVDSDGDITRIEYRFMDWYDGASRQLTGDDFDTAESMLGSFVEWALESERT